MLFTLPVFGDHDCNGLTNRLFGSVAKDPLCTPIPACDNAIEVLAYNHVVTGLDDGRQPAQLLFTFAKCGFGLLALRNVAIDFNHRTVTDQLLPALYNDFAAILAD